MIWAGFACAIGLLFGWAAAAPGVETALNKTEKQLDLGFGMYEMCPFPFGYLHACETSDQCVQTGCCAMFGFPGRQGYRRPCCVPTRLVRFARLTGLCVKSRTSNISSDCPKVENIGADECGGEPCKSNGDCGEPGVACCRMKCEGETGSFCYPVHAKK